MLPRSYLTYWAMKLVVSGMEKITFYFRNGTTWRFFIILLPHTHNHVDCTYGLIGLRKEKHMKLGELCCGWLMKVRGSESRFKIKKCITSSQINKSTYIWIAYLHFSLQFCLINITHIQSNTYIHDLGYLGLGYFWLWQSFFWLLLSICQGLSSQRTQPAKEVEDNDSQDFVSCIWRMKLWPTEEEFG